MLSKRLTGTFAAGVIAAGIYLSPVRAEDTNTFSISSYGFSQEVLRNTNNVPVSTNTVFKIVGTNAVPGGSYVLERRTYHTDGENQGHSWVAGPVQKGKSDNTVMFKLGDYNPSQEFFRIRYDTNEVHNEH